MELNDDLDDEMSTRDDKTKPSRPSPEFPIRDVSLEGNPSSFVKNTHMPIKSNFPDRLQVRLTSSVELIRASLEPYMAWIEQMIGVPLEQTLTLEVDADPGPRPFGVYRAHTPVHPGSVVKIPFRQPQYIDYIGLIMARVSRDYLSPLHE